MQQLLEFIGNHPFLVALLVGLLGAWIALEIKLKASSAASLSPFEFTRLLNAGNALLIDLRPGPDFDKGHIRGARHLTPSQVDPGAKDLVKAKERPVLLYCQTGMQSGEVGARLTKAGFAQVFHLKGGVAAWLQEQLPLERGKQKG